MNGLESAASAGSPAAEIRRAGRLSVYGLFASQVERDPEAIALEQGGATRSYADLNGRVLRLAAALRAKGVRYGDRIALVSENRCEYVEVELAAGLSRRDRRVPELASGRPPRSSTASISSRRRSSLPRAASRKLCPALDLRGLPILVIENEYEATDRKRAADAGGSRRRPGRRPGHPLHQRHDRPSQGRAHQPSRRDRAHDGAAHGLAGDRGGRLSRLGADVSHGLDRPDARAL